MATKRVRETHSKNLRVPEAAAEYLVEAIKSGDKTVIQMALRNIAAAYDVEFERVIGPVGKEFGGQDCEYE